jgi:hypothetical protein
VCLLVAQFLASRLAKSSGSAASFRHKPPNTSVTGEPAISTRVTGSPSRLSSPIRLSRHAIQFQQSLPTGLLDRPSRNSKKTLDPGDPVTIHVLSNHLPSAASPIATKASSSTSSFITYTQLLPPPPLPRLTLPPPFPTPPPPPPSPPPQSLFRSVYLFFHFLVILSLVLRSSLLDPLKQRLFDRFVRISLISASSGHRARGSPRSCPRLFQIAKQPTLHPSCRLDLTRNYCDTLFLHLWAAFSIFSLC